MAKRIIRTDEDLILRKKSRKVDKIDDKILVLLDDMVETMYDANGVGLAAPQIGILRRIVVIDIGEGPMKLINPEITFTEGEEEDLEGCLSVPGYNGLVKRPEKLICKYTNENNENIELEAEGFLARAICHELDHLDGILYTDKAETMYKIEEENA